ncbi:MAG: cohesin domain-containing protein [Candidatus Bathyarchaeia archaeon]
MKFKGNKIFYILTILTLLLALFPIIHTTTAQAKPKVYVEPKDNIFYTDTTSVGYEFTVSIMAADWPEPGVFSYELKLAYDKTMLEATKAEIPDGHWLTPSLKPGNIFIVDGGTINQEAGYVSFAATLLSPEPGKTGQGTIAKVTLKIIKAPPAAGKLSCLLELKDVILVDPAATEIPKANYDLIHGYFEFATPPPKLYLTIEPSLVTASVVGDEVNIAVMIKDVEADLKIIGVELKVSFNPAVLSIAAEDVVEGDFFKQFGGTFSVSAVEGGYVLTSVLLLPTETGAYPPTAKGFPSGSGTLATMKFKAISLPETVTEFPIEIAGVIIIDENLNIVPPRKLERAILLAPTRPEDLNKDGKVNIQDMAIFALAFGSYPGHARWNPKADIDGNGKVNILDGVMIAKAFGK